MRISIIITTYNNPAWLEKTLWGYAAQTDRDFSVLIADDGSTEETGQCIDRVRRETGLEMRRVWQEDDGFRKCIILNKAIAAAEADYLIFTDGDCIPRNDFVAVHRRFAQPGYFLSGGYFKLPLTVSQAITPEEIRANSIFDRRWLVRTGVASSLKLVKFHLSDGMATWCNRLTTTRPTFNGMNSSVWREDALRVNGFDERMQYGGLDREFGERLINAGVRPLQIRYHALCLHLDHGRGYRTPETLEKNRAIRRETREKKRTWTEYGIHKMKNEK